MEGVMPEHSKNWLYRQGQSDYTDYDYIEQLGLSPSLAGKEEINMAILEAVERQNIQGYINEGMSERKAKSFAAKQKSMAIKAAKAAGLKE